MQNDTAAMGPVFDRKSPKEYPKEVPMMMLGGSPHMVADPPRFAQKISASIKGTGSNLRADDNSIVTAARKRITVMLSMNCLLYTSSFDMIIAYLFKTLQEH